MQNTLASLMFLTQYFTLTEQTQHTHKIIPTPTTEWDTHRTPSRRWCSWRSTTHQQEKHTPGCADQRRRRPRWWADAPTRTRWWVYGFWHTPCPIASSSDHSTGRCNLSAGNRLQGKCFPWGDVLCATCEGGTGSEVSVFHGVMYVTCEWATDSKVSVFYGVRYVTCEWAHTQR